VFGFFMAAWWSPSPVRGGKRQGHMKEYWYKIIFTTTMCLHSANLMHKTGLIHGQRWFFFLTQLAGSLVTIMDLVMCSYMPASKLAAINPFI
jgi:hypothetical protein